MNNDEKRDLCLSLMQANSEADVVSVLTASDYWENRRVWRLYGDRENNYSTIGNQQNKPDAALVEKLINSVDARLMHECLAAGINPELPAAPQSIRQAVARFFEPERDENSVYAGQLRSWTNEMRRTVARGLTLSATGPAGREGTDPCLTIADLGEGQTPRKFLDTFLSLEKSNKLRIPFVQGKFNMGGTGVLEFCGRRNLQLILSRRSPRILHGNFDHPTDDEWGFTIVRREDPAENRKSSSYTFLAPVGADDVPQKGHVLTFAAPEMPIFAEGSDAYARTSEWGTLIKLYEYSVPGHRGHMLRKTGLLARLELLIPEPALPIRLHECRSGYGGRAGSYDTSLTGLGVRLDDGGRGENLEPDFPTSGPMICAGEPMTANIYAFKKGKADTYRRNEGIIFTVNGQTHGYLTADFFRRTRVGLSYLSDSLLVIVDCTSISPRGRELLFMNSRDRLRGGELCRELENELEDLLKNHPGLRALRERRRREEISANIDDSKPLEKILENLLKQSPSLANLFLFGKHASNPFKQSAAAAGEKPYHGEPYPSFFKFRGKDYGHKLQREAHINMRCRVAFDTDAANDYFSRSIDPGALTLAVNVDGELRDAKDAGYSTNVNLQNGSATLSIKFPEVCEVGDVVAFVAQVSDSTRLDPFENHFTVMIQKELVAKSGGNGVRNPPSNKAGSERETPGGIDIPKPIPVTEKDWESKGFDQFTALEIRDSGERGSSATGENDAVIYDFLVNVDNVDLKRFLKMELKRGDDDKVVRTRYELGMLLVGLALIHQDRTQKKHGDSDTDGALKEDLQAQVARVTKALSPFLLPMVDALGGLEDAETDVASGAGEAV